MCLYRGLKEPYRPDKARLRAKETVDGTDFTDCPFIALSYAAGRKGVVLVLDVADDAGCVTEETWFVEGAKRLMVWGTFDRWLVATIPAKDLRPEIRKKGIAGLPPMAKGEILRVAIEDRLRGSDGISGRLALLGHAFAGLALSNLRQGE